MSIARMSSYGRWPYENNSHRVTPITAGNTKANTHTSHTGLIYVYWLRK